MRRQDKMPARNKKNFRATKKGAGMTEAGVKVSNPSLVKYYGKKIMP